MTRWQSSRQVRLAIVVTLVTAGLLSAGEGTRIYLKAILAQILLKNAWSQTKAGEKKIKPWPWADTWPVARLSSPTHDQNMIVLAGVSGRTLAFGPGHLLASAAPGEVDNAVFVGHRDTHFAFLARVKAGEGIYLESPDGVRHRYRVNDTSVVHETETGVMMRNGLKTLTLITCFPFDAIVPGGPLRYVVQAFGTDPVTAATTTKPGEN